MKTMYSQIICPYNIDKSCAELRNSILQCETCAWSKDYTYTISSKVPYRCPICEGRGIVPGGFYISLSGGWGTSTNVTEPCRSCAGSGIIYA